MKLKYDDVLSNFAFNFNLRRFDEEEEEEEVEDDSSVGGGKARGEADPVMQRAGTSQFKVRRCGLNR